MVSKKVSTAIALALGLSVVGTASAATLSAGSYTMTIRTTPENYAPGSGIPDVGCTGSVCANSSFTFGGFPSNSSQRMTDNNVLVNGFGDTTADADGNAGVINFNVDGSGNLTFTGGQVDTIAGTAAGFFAQDLQTAGWSGTIDGAGNISFTPTGRMGNTSGPALVAPWNIDSGNPGAPTTNTAWTAFTTGTQVGNAGPITGAALDGAGHAVLVSTSSVGSAWGTFYGGTYYEVWSVDIAPAAVVPVPAAVWLFGSGLVGLVGIARRRRKA